MFRKLVLTVACVGLFLSLSRAQSLVYNSVPGPYFAAPPSSGLLGFDDYTTPFTNTGSLFELTSMQFVGGVTSILPGRNSLLFRFFNAANTVEVNNFSVEFPQAGNFIWTITFDPGENFLIPTAGVLRIETVQSTQGQFFLTSTAPSVGTNNPTFGGGTTVGGAPLYHAFSLTGLAIPEPGTVALLFAGGLPLAIGLLRRRRSI